MADWSRAGRPGRDPRREARRAAARVSRTAKVGLRGARRRAASAAEELRIGLHVQRELRIGHVDAPPLPEGIGEAVDLDAQGVDVVAEVKQGLDLVTVGPGGTDRISPRTLQVMLTCEQSGVPMVLMAEESRQLDTPTAAVVTHAATPNEDVHREMLDRMGPQRSFLIQDGESPRAQARRLLRLL